MKVTLPVGVSGSYYIIVDTDAGGAVFENGATANNVLATSSPTTVNLTPPPDLQVNSVAAVGTSVLAGHSLSIQYTVESEHGPEYSLFTNSCTLAAGRTKKLRVELKRFVDMPAKGWWPGELHVHRRLEDIELLMRAEELHIAPVITWWNNRNL